MEIKKRLEDDTDLFSDQSFEWPVIDSYHFVYLLNVLQLPCPLPPLPPQKSD